MNKHNFNIGDLVCVDLHIDVYFGFITGFNLRDGKAYYDVYIFIDMSTMTEVDGEWIFPLEEWKHRIQEK